MRACSSLGIYHSGAPAFPTAFESIICTYTYQQTHAESHGYLWTTYLPRDLETAVKYSNDKKWLIM